MRRRLAVLGAVAALGVVIPSSASADPVEYPNCHGKIVSFAAGVAGGAKNAADYFGLSVKDAQSAVREICDWVNTP